MSTHLAIRSTTSAIILPEALAEAAVVEFFGCRYITGVKTVRHRVELQDGQWAILLPDTAQARQALRQILPKSELKNVHPADGKLVLIQPAYTINLRGQSARRLKAALDDVRPRQPNGLPYPWVKPKAPTEPLGRAPDDHDVVITPQAQAEPETPEAETGELASEVIRADFDRIRQQLSLPDFPLVIRRGGLHRQGFVTGRVYIYRGEPIKMVLTTCPNSDRAEAAATLAHELAHIVSSDSAHGHRFKQTLAEIAEGAWGARFFKAARRAITQRYSVVDAWIAAGIRASLAGGSPPVEVHPQEAQAAVTIRRVQKLRALAQDQLGTPEACSAAAKANDLIVTHGLGTYRVALPADLEDEMCDQWIFIGKRKPWKAKIAFTVAQFCDVFALECRGYGGMHIFGRYADVITAEHLHAVAVERIESRCQQHIKRWRAHNPNRRGAAIVSERTSFLHSAADGLRAALEQAKGADDLDSVLAAEEFARVEHDKRGMGWRGGSGRGHVSNPAGFEAGNSLSLSKGLAGRPTKLLT